MSNNIQAAGLFRSTDFRLYNIFTALFVTVLVLASIASTKIASFGPLFLPAGTILFPITFIFNDILTETYGYARSRRILWLGLGCQLLTAVTLWIVGVLPPAPFWPHQQAYDAVLGFVPRIAFSGMVAYFCGEFSNSIVLSKMKFLQCGERGLKQGWRFVASTIVGEAVDSIVFMTLAFSGTIGTGDLIRTMVTLYLCKVIYEIVALPISTRFANWVKKVEGVDHIDTPETTNYNPFVGLLS